jgi:hypothetical protein
MFDEALGNAIVALLELSPVIAVLFFYILRLENRHKDLYERYVTLTSRYIRDIRAFAKLPADEFADDLNTAMKKDPP